MTIQIQKMTAKAARVVRVFEGDAVSIELARFEYSYQADIFAKAISRESDGFICVLGANRAIADGFYLKGRKVKAAAEPTLFFEVTSKESST